MDDFVQELIKDFLEESFSLIENLENSLLELEKSPDDSKAINEVFRVAHTIKGGAGTVGFDEIQNFTHVMEDAFDLVRKGKLTISPDDVSLLLEGCDVLNKMLVEREKGGTWDGEDRVRILDGLNAMKKRGEEVGEAPAPAAPKVEEPKESSSESPKPPALKLAREDLEMLSGESGSGKSIFVLSYRFDPEYEMRDLGPFQIFSLLRDVSTIVKTVPTMEELDKEFHEYVTFVISTVESVEYLKAKTNINEVVLSINVSALSLEKIESLLKQFPPAPAKEPETEESAPIQVEKSGEVAQAVQEIADTAEPTLKKKSSEEEEQIEKQRALATLKIESWKVDNLLNLLGELVITRANFSQAHEDLEKVMVELKSLMKEFLTGIAKINFSGDEKDVAEKNKRVVEILHKFFSTVDDNGENIQQLTRISGSIQEDVMNMRMVPIQMVFQRFPRLVRDMARKLGKKIDLSVEGVDTEVDKGIVDDLFDPLVHLIRNSVDHGVEDPETRSKLGKPESGKIVLKAQHEGDSIVIEVKDDGKGLNTQKLKEKAIAKGFVTAEAAEQMSERELLSLIFIPGFSTAKEVSNLSGRGVGMDAVKKKIEEIGGSVGIATVLGKGTRIIIRLPLTMAIIQGLLVTVEGMNYVVPVAAVQETLIIDLKDISEINGQYAFEFRGELIPILPLQTFFYQRDLEVGEQVGDVKKRQRYCILVRYGGRSVGIVVHDILGEQDIVIKSLNTKLIHSPGISAATIVGGGELGYIIEPAQVISRYFKDAKTGVKEA